jgi:hypothetical protein
MIIIHSLGKILIAAIIIISSLQIPSKHDKKDYLPYMYSMTFSQKYMEALQNSADVKLKIQLKKAYGNGVKVEEQSKRYMYIRPDTTYFKYKNYEELNAITDSIVSTLQPVFGFDKDILLNESNVSRRLYGKGKNEYYFICYNQYTYWGMSLEDPFLSMSFCYRASGRIDFCYNYNPVVMIEEPPYLPESKVEKIAENRIKELYREIADHIIVINQSDSISYRNGLVISNRKPLGRKYNPLLDSKYDYRITQEIRNNSFGLGHQVLTPRKVLYKIEFYDHYEIFVDAKTGKVVDIRDYRIDIPRKINHNF